MAYNNNLDYSDLIKQAASKGDFAMAAALESSRNDKIQSQNLGYEQTNDYANYLGKEEYKPVGDTTSGNTDWSDVINNLISSGASSQRVGEALQSRKQKALSTPGLGQYAYDDVFNRAIEYINQNKSNDNYNALLDSIVNRDKFSFDPATNPSYQAYATQYKNQGKAAMQDTMGEYAGLTGGLPSSAAVSAGQQAYNSQMSKLSGVIPELYGQAYGEYQNDFSNDVNALAGLRNERELDYNLATMAAEYGDYSGLQSLGVSPDIANIRALAQAKKVKTGSGSETGKPKLTAAQAASAAKSGITTDEVKNAYDYYYGEGSYEKAKMGTGGGKPTLTAAQAASAAKSGIITDEVKYAYDYYYGEGTFEKAFYTPIKRFQAGDFSDEVIAGLVEKGYTQKQIVDSGYVGDYFKKNSPIKTGNYQAVSETLAAMKASGVSKAEILSALKEIKNELSQTDYISLYNKYRG